MKFKPNEKHEAILKAEKHGLVLGGPGSGKTTLALMKALRRIERKLLPGQSVLFLSFSRAAVARIISAAKDAAFDDKRGALAIQTFHSFFWEILRTHGHLLGPSRPLKIILSHEEKALCNGIKHDDPGWPQWEKERRRIFEEQGRVCFDLFAPLTAELFSRAKRIRDRVAKRYPLILVDEAQDTSTDQWNCVKDLAKRSQVICLADLDQLIFDHLPGVGPERVDEIRAALDPIEVDLGADNNRSPGTEILAFAKDIAHRKVRGTAYKNVSRQTFNPKPEDRDAWIRKSIGIVRKQVREATGAAPDSIGIIASYQKGVAEVSAALRKGPPSRAPRRWR